jgi:urease accessory protein
VRITQQAATKIHPSQNRRAIQKLHILVEAGAALRIHFEPIIPFAGSRLVQTTRIDAQPGARISYWESFMAGRIARGECWQFDELSSETDFRVGGKSVYLERFLLPNGLERSACGMAGCGYWGTGLYMDAHDDAAAGRLHRALPAAGVDRLPSGLAAVRLVAATGPEFHASRAAFECETGTVA